MGEREKGSGLAKVHVGQKFLYYNWSLRAEPVQKFSNLFRIGRKINGLKRSELVALFVDLVQVGFDLGTKKQLALANSAQKSEELGHIERRSPRSTNNTIGGRPCPPCGD